MHIQQVLHIRLLVDSCILQVQSLHATRVASLVGKALVSMKTCPAIRAHSGRAQNPADHSTLCGNQVMQGQVQSCEVDISAVQFVSPLLSYQHKKTYGGWLTPYIRRNKGDTLNEHMMDCQNVCSHNHYTMLCTHFALLIGFQKRLA